jgi:flagellar biogenesis protein FliO
MNATGLQVPSTNKFSQAPAANSAISGHTALAVVLPSLFTIILIILLVMWA